MDGFRGLRSIVSGRALCIAALAAVAILVSASAQAIEGGDSAGRVRERFVAPPPPQAQPAGPVVVLYFNTYTAPT